MTPEQIDTVTTALINLHDAVDRFGPGLLAGAIAGVGYWALRRIEKRITTRRALRRLEHYANHPANRAPRKEDTP